jgi:hypothetical protein
VLGPATYIRVFSKTIPNGKFLRNVLHVAANGQRQAGSETSVTSPLMIIIGQMISLSGSLDHFDINDLVWSTSRDLRDLRHTKNSFGDVQRRPDFRTIEAT